MAFTFNSIGGLFLKYNTASKLDILVGECSFQDSATQGVSASAFSSGVFTKDLAAAWAAGDGNGGLVSGSVAANTCYHVMAIQKQSDSSIDFCFGTSVGSGTTGVPAGYIFVRRLGSVLTDSSGFIRKFIQIYDEFWLFDSIKDVDVTNPGTAAVTRQLTVPTGVVVQAIITSISWDSTQATIHYISSLFGVDDETPSYADAIETAGSDRTGEGYMQNRVWTQDSGQVRSRMSVSGANTQLKIRTRGWVDLRGKNGQQ